MGGGCNPLSQFLLAPTEPQRSLQIPAPFLIRVAAFQDHHVLRPAYLHSRTHQGGAALIGAVEIPHPPQVARGEAAHLRVGSLQIFRRSHSRSLFRAGADHCADLPVQLHLRQVLPQQTIQSDKQQGIIYWLANVHGLLLPGLRSKLSNRPLRAIANFHFYSNAIAIVPR